MSSREQLLARTFVELADTLVADFDLIDFLHLLARRSAELLDASAAGIMLSDQRGGLTVMASSTEEARLLELFELQNDEGPCLDCFRVGAPVEREDPQAMRSTWPVFTERMEELGFTSAQAIPLRLRADSIGALNIFRTGQGPMAADDLQIAQALADVATIGLLQERAVTAEDHLAEQLQAAMNSRILLEQAKGVVAERTGLQMDDAFQAMREYARVRELRLAHVAQRLIDGSVEVPLLLPRPGPPAEPDTQG
ncbi:MAG: GAF and ANTAR domain-containing protein [Geodermatophilaceae bacterium]|nr:GAF and ANTAR domain-containing protein [Geodermatophilaceae bacterium]